MSVQLSRLLLVLVSLCVLTACPALEELTREGQSGPNESRVAAGLREALRVGTERASERTGRADGYLGNELIRIPLPERLQTAGSQLRRVGLGRQVDELEVAMNRAAELAAREAGSVFADAIRRMQPADVYAVFNGGPDAATRYLRQSAEAVLKQRYQPIVADRLEGVNGYAVYQDIVARWNRLPLVEPLEFDLEDYVTERALDGIFTVLAEEEQRIRQDPVARTTQLLRDVFGG